MASTRRLNVRTLLLIIAEALLIFLAMVAAAYLRLGWADAYFELNDKNGFAKAAVVTLFCLAAFYLYDLYDFVVMHDRRELVLRLVQALGLAWVALAIVMYLLPQLMIGRGVSLILCKVGRRKAAVLPVPVSAQPMRSAPVSTTGIARSWIGVGSV